MPFLLVVLEVEANEEELSLASSDSCRILDNEDSASMGVDLVAHSALWILVVGGGEGVFVVLGVDAGSSS